jgi:hypothetical protein
MAKRDSLKGRGADIFFDEEPAAAQPQTPPGRATARSARRRKAETVKLTVYIRPDLNAQLDQLWLQRRMQDVAAQKSLIVEEALQLLFAQEHA